MSVIVTLTMNPALDVAPSAASVRPGHKLRGATPQFDPGGGGINVARTIAALGGDALAIFPSGGAAENESSTCSPRRACLIVRWRSPVPHARASLSPIVARASIIASSCLAQR